MLILKIFFEGCKIIELVSLKNVRRNYRIIFALKLNQYFFLNHKYYCFKMYSKASLSIETIFYIYSQIFGVILILDEKTAILLWVILDHPVSRLKQYLLNCWYWVDISWLNFKIKVITSNVFRQRYNVASQTGPTLRRNYLSIFFSINSTAISSVTDNLIMEKILCADTILLIENVKAT